MALIDEIENFCTEQNMPGTRFGKIAAYDGGLIRAIKGGRDIPGPLEERIRGFMRNYRAGLIVIAPSEPRAKAPSIKSEASYRQQQARTAYNMGEMNAHRRMMIVGSAALRDAVLGEINDIMRRRENIQHAQSFGL